MERERISVSLAASVREKLLAYAERNGLKEATAATVLLTRTLCDAVAPTRGNAQQDAAEGGKRRQTR